MDLHFIALFQGGIHDDHLRIALEPEAASVYCKHLCLEARDDLEGFRALGTFSPGSKYLVLDAGGDSLHLLFIGAFYIALIYL